MKLLGAVTQGSGNPNEDAYGFVGPEDDVSAAWVFDGVTGVNAAPVLGVASEPAWFVSMADRHLRDVVSMQGDVLNVLRELVPRLQDEWLKASRGRNVPEGYDLPAACLLLAKRVEGKWQALRLGDSYLLSDGVNHPFPPDDLPDLEAELKREVRKQRDTGMLDMKALHDHFRPRLLANRRNRNLPGSYSILVPDETSLAMPQVIELGAPKDMLLCSDGFYRAVDIYGFCDDAALMARSVEPEKVLAEIRAVEAADPSCEKCLRFKPADDVTAIRLQI